MAPKKRSSKKAGKSPANEVGARREGISGWSKGPVNLTFRKGQGVVFSLRLTADELEEIRDRAQQQGISVSELMRRALFPEPIRLVRGSLTLTAVDAQWEEFGRPQTGMTVEAQISEMPQDDENGLRKSLLFPQGGVAV